MTSSEYSATIRWQRNPDEDYLGRQYSRIHQWAFDGGTTVSASPSPHVVPAPYSREDAVDPEEAFVASLSSCHMLFFLELAAIQRFEVESYIDDAIGILSENAHGKMSMTKVTLRPRVTFSGGHLPDHERIKKIHHQAHERCYIANSVTTEVVVQVQP